MGTCDLLPRLSAERGGTTRSTAIRACRVWHRVGFAVDDARRGRRIIEDRRASQDREVEDMKRALTGLLALLVVLSLIAMPAPAAAWGQPVPHGRFPHGGFPHGHFHHRHFGGGVAVGVLSGLAVGALLAAPVYAAPPAVVYAPPPVSAPPPPAPAYWYYCQNPAGYYPYVSQCPGGWLTVPPQPGS